jgi:hypothetical protein
MIPLIRAGVKPLGIGAFGKSGTIQSRRENLSCRSPIFLTRTSHNDLKRVIEQGPLQGLCLVPWGAHPHVAIFVRRQDNWHRLRMDRLDDRVRRCREETVNLMRTRHRL